MKATSSMSLVVVVVMVAMVSAAPQDQSCKTNRMMDKKIWAELLKNMTMSVCSASDTTQCLPKLKDCYTLLQAKYTSSEEDDQNSQSVDEDALLANVAEDIKETKKLMEICVVMEGIQGVNLDAAPQPPKTMEELTSSCINLQTLMLILNIKMEYLLPITSCMLNQQGKLEPFAECVNSQ